MGHNDVFSVLDLPPQASEEEIHAAFRTLAWRHHPDRGGDAEAMQRLSSAYQEALAIARRRDMVPVAVVQELVSAVEQTQAQLVTQLQLAEKRADVQAKRERSARVTHQIVNRRQSRYKRLQHIAGIVAILSTGIGLFGGNVIDSTNKVFGNVLPALTAPLLILAGVLLGLSYVILDSLARREEKKIHEFSDLIDSEFMTAQFISTTIPSYMDDMFDEDGHKNFLGQNEIDKYLVAWKKSKKPDQLRLMDGSSIEARARKLHIQDLADIIQAKAVEFGLLEHTPAVMKRNDDTSHEHTRVVDFYSRTREAATHKWSEDR